MTEDKTRVKIAESRHDQASRPLKSLVESLTKSANLAGVDFFRQILDVVPGEMVIAIVWKEVPHNKGPGGLQQN